MSTATDGAFLKVINRRNEVNISAVFLSKDFQTFWLTYGNSPSSTYNRQILMHSNRLIGLSLSKPSHFKKPTNGSGEIINQCGVLKQD